MDELKQLREENRLLRTLLEQLPPSAHTAESDAASPEIPFRAVVEQSIVGLYVIQDGVFQYVNPRYAELYGYRQAELLARRVEDFVYEEDRPLYHENIRKRVSGEVDSIRYRLRGKRKDGGLVDMEAHGTRFQFRGRPAVIGVQIDVSEPVRLERELRESEARLRAMTANVPGVVFQLIADVGGITFSHLSQGIVDLCGMSADTIYGDFRHFIGLLHADDSPSFWEGMRVSQLSRADWHWEGRINAPGQERWLGLHASARGGPSGVVWDGLLLDITGAKHKEEKIRQSEERLRELTSHLNSIREEERTRIAREIHDVLGGILTTLKMDVIWLAKQQEAQAAIERAGGLRVMIQEAIETVQKIASDLRPGVLDNLGLFAALDWQAKEFSKRMNMPCDLTLPDDLPTLVEPHATSLFRIVQEALTNVVRHADATAVNITVPAIADVLEIRLVDNGVGISAAQLRHPKAYGIMGMFERAREIGAVLTLAPGARGGTELILRYPLSQPDGPIT